MYKEVARDIIEKSKNRKPESDKDMARLADAYIVMAGDKIVDMMMGSQMNRYDGRMDDYARRTGMHRDGRRDGMMGRFAYDGGEDNMYDGERMYYDDDMDDEDEYYNGKGVSRRNGRRMGARKNISGGIK